MSDPSLPECFTPPPVSLALVLPRLDAYAAFVHRIAACPAIAEVEFTYGAPLYKATPAIAAALPGARGALDKFDLYFSQGILEESLRVRLAAQFRRQYLTRHPGSEGSDVFAASADVLQFRFRLDDPRQLPEGRALLLRAAEHPHDARVLADWRRGRPIERPVLMARCKLFLDHVYNPRRRSCPEVQTVMTGSRTHDPVILELEVHGALPGLFWGVLEPHLDAVDGALAWLPG